MAFSSDRLSAAARSANISIIDDSAPGLAGDLAAFWSEKAYSGEIDQVLSTIGAGTSVFVAQQFQRSRDPWQLRQEQSCPANAECTNRTFDHFWLVKPKNWWFGPVLMVGAGSASVQTKYPADLPPFDEYTPTGPTSGATFVAPMLKGGFVVVSLPQNASLDQAEWESLLDNLGTEFRPDLF